MIRLEFQIGLQYDVYSPTHFMFHFAAAHTPAQTVLAESASMNGVLTPAFVTEPVYGNRVLRLKAGPGPLQVSYAATVDIAHTLEDPLTVAETPIDALPVEVLPFILASRYCPSDRLVQFAHTEFGQLPPGYSRVEAIRAWVQARTRFTIGCSTPATTALDTLTEQRGVCRDFSHLMIALCRALNIPARFVTGLDYGAHPSLGPPDFHAYVEAWLGGRWYLFDPTGISPVTGLVRLGTGRDAADVAFCTSFGSVRLGVPVVAIRAVEDAALGLELPQRTTLAVSTAGDAGGAGYTPMSTALAPPALRAPELRLVQNV